MQITDLNTTLSNITATAVANDYNSNCPGNTLIADVQSLQGTLTGVVTTIQDVEDLTGCESIQPLFFDLINKGWCTEWYTGIFYIWGSMLWTNFFLFLSVLVASYVWQYYGFWNGVPVTEVNHDFEQVNPPEEDDESDEEHGGSKPTAHDAQRDAYFESPHVVQGGDPYAAPNAHQDIVIPAQVVYVNPHEDEAG